MLSGRSGRGSAHSPGWSWGGVMSNRKDRRRAAAARRSAKPITQADRRQLLSRGLMLLGAIIVGALLLGWMAVNGGS